MDHMCLNCGNKHELTSKDILSQGCPDCGCQLFSYAKSQPSEISVDIEDSTEKSERKEKPDQQIIEKVETILFELEDKYEEVSQEDLRFNLESIKIKDEGVFEISLDNLSDEKPLIVEFREGKYHIHLSSLFGDKKRIDLDDLDI